MLCANCGYKLKEDEKFCGQCGRKVEPDHTDSQVKSMEAWKLRKSEEKDAARKQKIETEKEKLDAIKQRMYRQQAGFDIDQLIPDPKASGAEGPKKKETEEKDCK